MPADMLHAGGEVFVHPDLAGLLDDDLDHIRPHPRNPRNGDTEAIVESIRANGLYRPLYAQRSTGCILAGNHTYAAALELGATALPVIWLDVDDDRAERIMLVDNRSADLGTYDDGLLVALLRDLDDTEASLLGTGYTEDDLLLLTQGLDAIEPDEDENRAPTTGEMLSIADVTWGEPKTHPTHGQVWRLGPHTLVIAKVHDEHHLWRHLLTDETLLCPYPEPYLTSGTVAEQRPMLLIQPNVFLAGHLIDKHIATHPDHTVEPA